jgi:beta-N-acetylhexosaminidase
VPDLDAYREQASGLVVMRLGNNMPPPRRAEDEAAGIHRLLERYPFAGLILFNGAWPQTRQTLLDLQRAAARPLLVMTDMERGLGQQVRGATLFPHALAFERLGEEAVEAFARVAAREALACGVHVAFAPVVDVSRNPRNPIISTRAFGTNAETASRLGAAFVRGARAEGLLTTAKHFPGHGNTEEDSHATLPTVRDSREEMDQEDLPPFRAAFAAGADLVMTAHVAYPALDPSGRPATLSRPILTGLLRDELGFEGVVISDSLQMAGIQASDRTEAQVAAEQILAGVDLLLDPQNPETLIEGLAQAMASGDLPEDRVQEALGRADRLRRHLTGPVRGRPLDRPLGDGPAGGGRRRSPPPAGRARRARGRPPGGDGPL